MILHRSPSSDARQQPLYKQVKSVLIERIATGVWKPGDMLPVEKQLAQEFNVGNSTIRAAVGELVNADIVTRVQGKGTFVTLHDPQHSIFRFFRVVSDTGLTARPISELVSFARAHADEHVSRLLQLTSSPKAMDIYELRNILFAAETPVVISDISIPTAFFPKLSPRLLNEGNTTIYAVYQKQYGVTIVRTTEKIKAILADKDASKIFKIETGAPILEIQRVGYTFGGIPVEVRRSRVRTDRYHYFLQQGDSL